MRVLFFFGFLAVLFVQNPVVDFRSENSIYGVNVRPESIGGKLKAGIDSCGKFRHEGTGYFSRALPNAEGRNELCISIQRNKNVLHRKMDEQVEYPVRTGKQHPPAAYQRSVPEIECKQ